MTALPYKRPLLDWWAALLAPSAPPSLLALQDLLENSEGMADFFEAVRELVPEDEDYILDRSFGPYDRGNAFIECVQAKYDLPLMDTGAGIGYFEFESYADVLCYVPVEVFGWTSEQYEDPSTHNPGTRLLLVFLAHPYDAALGPDRTSWFAEAENVVPRELLEDVLAANRQGWLPKDLEERLAGTPYAALADLARWLHHETGLIFLDCDYENSENDIGWSHEELEALGADWRESRALMDGVNALAEAVELDPEYHMRNILRLLAPAAPPKEQLRFPQLAHVPKGPPPEPLVRARPRGTALAEVFAPPRPEGGQTTRMEV